MNDEALIWFRYAEENLKSAEILLKSELLNPCLQNAQQAVEKTLKSILIENFLELRRTHSTTELVNLLREAAIIVELSDEECDLFDAIYLPTKYPLGSAMPDFNPDKELCYQCIAIAERLIANTRKSFDL